MADAVRVDASELVSAVYRLRAKGGNLRGVLPVLGEALVAAVSDVFEAEGPNWEPLAESTKRGRRGTTHKILQDTGLFAASLEKATGADWVEARSGVAYGEFHATGTSRMKKRNPFELGPFEKDFLDDAADVVAREVTQ